MSVQEKGVRAGVDGERTGRGRKAACLQSTEQPPGDPHMPQPPPLPFTCCSLRMWAAGKARSLRLKAAISTAPSFHHLMLPNGRIVRERK